MSDLEKKKKLEMLQEKLLKEHPKKLDRLSEILQIAFHSKLDSLEDAVILGAFLEIAEKMQDPDKIQEWKKNGERYSLQGNKNPKTKLIISFASDPGEEIKAKLKELRFQWKSFKREFCGYGNQEEVENLLSGTEHRIKIVE